MRRDIFFSDDLMKHFNAAGLRGIRTTYARELDEAPTPLEDYRNKYKH